MTNLSALIQSKSKSSVGHLAEFPALGEIYKIRMIYTAEGREAPMIQFGEGTNDLIPSKGKCLLEFFVVNDEAIPESRLHYKF